MLARRFVASVVVLLLGLAGTAGAGGQGAASATQRTPWGDPDLQGIWEYWTFTPLQRPDDLSDRAVLTEEEAAAVGERSRQAALTRDRETPAEGDTGAYGQEVWTERSRATALTQASLIVDPPDGKIPPFTASEERRMEEHRRGGGRPVRTRARGIGSDGPEDRGLAERCIVGFSTGPPLLPAGYNNNLQVFQAPGYVVLAVEMIHDVRVVPLDGRPHLPDNMRQWLGDARGRWEGDTLVVETTNFTDKIASFSTTSVSWGTGGDLKLIERFTRIDDGTLQYEFTVENPSIFTRPFTARYPMNRSDLPLYEYACHEGNYGLMNILTGARAEDAAAAP